MKERLLFFSLRTTVPGTEKIREAHLEEHRAFLADLEKSGKVIMHGRLADRSGALLIFDTNSEEEAKTLIGKDPLSIYGGVKDEIKAWNCRLIKVNLDSS